MNDVNFPRYGAFGGVRAERSPELLSLVNLQEQLHVARKFVGVLVTL